MAADTRCTINLADSNTPLLLEQPTPFGITITSASRHSMKASSKGHLPFNLPAQATECHCVPKLHTPLLSIGQACDAHCTAIFTSDQMHLLHNKDVDITMKATPILTGTRTNNGLWMVPVTTKPKPTTHLCNSAYTQRNTKDLTLFLHAALGYPPTKTLCQAIDKGFLATFPGLHSKAARKHIHNSIPTLMGRLTRTRGGIRPTHNPASDPDGFQPPPMLEPTKREHLVGSAVFKMNDLKGLICTDLPGRFPFISSRGNNYIFVLYDYDSNAILATPIKSRQTQHLIQGYDFCYNLLKKAGIIPTLQRLDNEVSKELIASIESKHVEYQLANAHDHRHNLAERAICTFKSHFISILNGTDSCCLPHLWCRLIPQAVTTLNML